MNVDIFLAVAFWLLGLLVAVTLVRSRIRVRHVQRLTMFTDDEIAALEKHPASLQHVAAINREWAEGQTEWGNPAQYRVLYDRSAFFAAEAERHTP